MSTVARFALIEKGVKQVIEEKYAPAAEKVGRDLSYVAGEGLYVWLGLIPGSGGTDRINGSWAMDIDVFGDSYVVAMGHALEIEAILLAAPHRSAEMIIDSVFQNSTPSEVPWDDDNVYRISATYVFTARRSG